MPEPPSTTTTTTTTPPPPPVCGWSKFKIVTFSFFIIISLNIIFAKGNFITEPGEECDCGPDYLQCQVNITILLIIVIIIPLIVLTNIIIACIAVFIPGTLVQCIISTIAQDACCYPATISLYDLSSNHSAQPCSRNGKDICLRPYLIPLKFVDIIFHNNRQLPPPGLVSSTTG